MNKHGIVCTASEVRAYLSGRSRKTMFRVAVKAPTIQASPWLPDKKHILFDLNDAYPNGDLLKVSFAHPGDGFRPNDKCYQNIECPYKVGDRLFVKETFAIESTYGYDEASLQPKDRPFQIVEDDDGLEYYLIPHYRATESEPHIVLLDNIDSGNDKTQWRPSIHMPEWASRIHREITDVRAEKLWSLMTNDDDIIAEGVKGNNGMIRYQNMMKHWNSLPRNRKHQWGLNEFVWVVTTKQVEVE